MSTCWMTSKHYINSNDGFDKYKMCFKEFTELFKTIKFEKIYQIFQSWYTLELQKRVVHCNFLYQEVT